VQAIVTVLAVINPVVCGSIFLMLTRQLDSDKKYRAAINVAFFILAILVFAALVGLKVLRAPRKIATSANLCESAL
jgi:small neutral amino acid transporter SnatA (MarC family)